MTTSIDTHQPLYFRCHRLAATITPEQCRRNRQRCDQLLAVEDLRSLLLEEVRAPCLHCPQAPQVDAGRVRMFTIPQVLQGQAREEPAADILPAEWRTTAQPSDQHAFTSNFWVPEWNR